MRGECCTDTGRMPLRVIEGVPHAAQRRLPMLFSDHQRLGRMARIRTGYSYLVTKRFSKRAEGNAVLKVVLEAVQQGLLTGWTW